MQRKENKTHWTWTAEVLVKLKYFDRTYTAKKNYVYVLANDVIVPLQLLRPVLLAMQIVCTARNTQAFKKVYIQIKSLE